MIRNDKVKGTPLVQYKDTKANIEALSGIEEAAIAYATDTNEFGSYDGTTWTWGQSGSFDLAAAIHAATEDTSLSNDDEFGIWESISGLLRKIKWSTIVSGLGAYFVAHSSSTAANDFLVGSGTGAWIKKTLAQTVTILQSSLDSIYAAITHTHIPTDITGLRFIYPFASYINISPLTSTNSFPFSATLPSFTSYPKQYSQAVFIAAGTNNTTNYWTLELKDAGTNTVIASVTTYGLTANAGYTLTDTSMALSSLTQATHKYLYLVATKTGAPANLNVHAPSVEYELS